MSNVVQVLERAGAGAVINQAELSRLIDALSVEGVEAGYRQALLDQDSAVLVERLGGRPRMICAIYAPEEQPLREGEEHEGDQDGREGEQEEQRPE